jgi:hypothetical protein
MGLHPATGPLTFVALVLFGLYMAWEIWRWYSGNRSGLTPGQFRRRVVGGVLLEAALLLWFFANTPIVAGLTVREKLAYLLVAFVLTWIPMFLAVREAAFVARQYARWRADLIRNMAAEERRRHEGHEA